MTDVPDDRRAAPRRKPTRRDRYPDSVFVNCPFDESYRLIFQAVVFTLLDCEFVPRCALEIGDSSEVRIDKILRIIERCRLGIHDISRTELDRATGLPRFNMPLELGLFLGAKRFGTGRQRLKKCLILDREPYRYQKFCSDIAGHDLRSHADSHRSAIAEVRDWLQNVRRSDHRPSTRGSIDQVIIPGGRLIVDRFERFRIDLPRLCEESGHDEARLEYSDFLLLSETWQEANDPPRPR